MLVAAPAVRLAAVPLKFVAVMDEGVPPAPLNNTGAPADPILTPNALKIPVPVVTVPGANPAPPPTTKELAANAADVAQVEALLKYGMPPDVPATVRASVPLDVMGEPETLISPPVKLCATLVTVPTAAAAQVGAPAPFDVKTCPLVPARLNA
jgi:hypothetical protein